MTGGLTETGARDVDSSCRRDGGTCSGLPS